MESRAGPLLPRKLDEGGKPELSETDRWNVSVGTLDELSNDASCLDFWKAINPFKFWGERTMLSGLDGRETSVVLSA
jgi:hypothetical protein